MADKANNPSHSESQDSLLDALESIKGLLEKSDAKLSAARESIAIASNQTEQNSLGGEENAQLEIPVLDDVVIPGEEASSIMDAIETITEAASQSAEPGIAEPAKTDPEEVLQYIDKLQKSLEKSIRDSLMKSVVTIEKGLKETLSKELAKVREQVKKDFS